MAYSIDTLGDLRIITMHKSEGMRYRFYKQATGQRIKFTIKGAKLQASVMGQIIAYNKPKINNFHWEYMILNTQQLRAGKVVTEREHDTLIENMLEFIEKV